MDFTLPMRPSTKQGLARHESNSDLRAISEYNVESTRDASARGMARYASNSDLRAVEHDAKSKREGNPLKAAKSLAQLVPPALGRILRTKQSRSKLAPISSDRVSKPSFRKTATTTNLRAVHEASTPEVESQANEDVERADEARNWAIVEDYMQLKAFEKKVGQSMRTLSVRPKQSLFRLGERAPDEEQVETKEQVLQKLTARDLPVNVHLCLSFKLQGTGVALASDVLIMVNDQPDFAAFAAQLQFEHSSKPGVLLLRSTQPKHWVFRSRLGRIKDHELDPLRGKEYSSTCTTRNVDVGYKQFLEFMYRKGHREAEEEMQKAKRRIEHSKAMRKDASELAVDGRKREFAEVHVPGAVNIHGSVDLFF